MTPSTLTPKSPSIARHLTPKPLLRPECGSSDIVTGIATTYGAPVFCLTCGTMTEVKREVIHYILADHLSPEGAREVTDQIVRALGIEEAA